MHLATFAAWGDGVCALEPSLLRCLGWMALQCPRWARIWVAYFGPLCAMPWGQLGPMAFAVALGPNGHAMFAHLSPQIRGYWGALGRLCAGSLILDTG